MTVIEERPGAWGPPDPDGEDPTRVFIVPPPPAGAANGHTIREEGGVAAEHAAYMPSATTGDPLLAPMHGPAFPEEEPSDTISVPFYGGQLELPRNAHEVLRTQRLIAGMRREFSKRQELAVEPPANFQANLARMTEKNRTELIRRTILKVEAALPPMDMEALHTQLMAYFRNPTIPRGISETTELGDGTKRQLMPLTIMLAGGQRMDVLASCFYDPKCTDDDKQHRFKQMITLHPRDDAEDTPLGEHLTIMHDAPGAEVTAQVQHAKRLGTEQLETLPISNIFKPQSESLVNTRHGGGFAAYADALTGKIPMDDETKEAVIAKALHLYDETFNNGPRPNENPLHTVVLDGPDEDTGSYVGGNSLTIMGFDKRGLEVHIDISGGYDSRGRAIEIVKQRYPLSRLPSIDGRKVADTRDMFTHGEHIILETKERTLAGGRRDALRIVDPVHEVWKQKVARASRETKRFSPGSYNGQLAQQELLAVQAAEEHTDNERLLLDRQEVARAAAQHGVKVHEMAQHLQAILDEVEAAAKTRDLKRSLRKIVQTDPNALDTAEEQLNYPVSTFTLNGRPMAVWFTDEKRKPAAQIKGDTVHIVPDAQPDGSLTSRLLPDYATPERKILIRPLVWDSDTGEWKLRESYLHTTEAAVQTFIETGVADDSLIDVASNKPFATMGQVLLNEPAPEPQPQPVVQEVVKPKRGLGKLVDRVKSRFGRKHRS